MKKSICKLLIILIPTMSFNIYADSHQKTQANILVDGQFVQLTEISKESLIVTTEEEATEIISQLPPIQKELLKKDIVKKLSLKEKWGRGDFCIPAGYSLVSFSAEMGGELPKYFIPIPLLLLALAAPTSLIDWATGCFGNL